MWKSTYRKLLNLSRKRDLLNSETKSPRTIFYSALMSKLEGMTGEKISQDYTYGNTAQFAQTWWKVTNDLILDTVKGDRRPLQESLDLIKDKINEIKE